MVADAGPAHGPPVNPEITESNDDADARKSAANPSHADAAVNNGPDPAPVKIRAELISGGNQEKSNVIATPNQPAASTASTTTNHPQRPLTGQYLRPGRKVNHTKDRVAEHSIQELLRNQSGSAKLIGVLTCQGRGVTQLSPCVIPRPWQN